MITVRASIRLVTSNYLFTLLFLAALLLVSGIPNLKFQAYGHEAENALTIAIARSDAVFSGRFKYREETRISPTKSPTVKEFELVMMGSSWKRRQVLNESEIEDIIPPELEKKFPNLRDQLKNSKNEGQVEIIEISNNGRNIVYKSVPQLDGKTTKTSRVATGENSPNKVFPPLPLLLGSFWFADTKQFVATHTKNAIHSTMAQNNNGRIDVYEFPVLGQTEAYEAFHVVHDLTSKGGTLRVYISVNLGGVVTKIEHVGVEGLGTVLESGDFIEVNGVRMPRECKLQYFSAQGPQFSAKYTFSEITDINVAIPEKEFVIELPIGTIVADARDPKESKFFDVNGPDALPPDLDDVYVLPKGEGASYKLWWWAVTGGLVLGLVSVWGTKFARRLRLFRGGVS